MAIKTRDEIFGDDGANGAAVPMDNSNPAGTDAGNRGVGFGEALTSAIINRTTGALADNDEDLDTRLGNFETEGLDAAYDLGEGDDAGGGRVITKDGGAVETVSLLTTDYEDDGSNAHFKANASADTKTGSVGFDFKGARSVRGSGAAGFVDRRIFTYEVAGQGTLLTASEAVTLNPGGASPTMLRLTSGSFFWQDGTALSLPAGNHSQLLLGVDMVEVTVGSATNLYLVTALGTTEEDVLLRSITGDSPSFGTDVAATAVFYRPAFASWGTDTGGGRAEAQGPTLVSGPSDTSPALQLVTDKSDILQARWKTAGGALRQGLRLDRYGRIHSTLKASQLEVSSDEPNYSPGSAEGDYLTHIDKTSNPADSGSVSHIITSNDENTIERNDLLSLDPIVLASHAIALDMPFTVVGVSSGIASLNLDAASLVTDWTEYLPSRVTFAYIQTTNHTGIYRVSNLYDASLGGSDIVDLRSLTRQDVELTASETGTITFLRAVQLGKISVPFRGETTTETVVAGAVMTSPTEDGVALLLATPVGGSILRGMGMRENTESGQLEEVLRVSEAGFVAAKGFALHGDAEEDRVFTISGAKWHTPTPGDWTQDKTLGRVTTAQSGADAWMDISDLVPPNCNITEVSVVLSAAASYDANGAVLELYYRYRDGAASLASNTLEATSGEGTQNNVQLLTLTHSFDRDSNTLVLLRVVSGDLDSGSDIFSDVTITLNSNKVGW